MATLKVLSLNVRGLREKPKRCEIFEWLKTYHMGNESIIFLQETHSTPEIEKLWIRDWGAPIFFSHGTSASAGVAILLPRNINPDLVKMKRQEDGRKMLIELASFEEKIFLLNVYAPTSNCHKAQSEFIDGLVSDMEQYADSLIIGGDFNIHLNPELDKFHNSSQQTFSSTRLNTIINDFDFIDIWRLKNPTLKRYTWSRKKPLTQSRLDYWFIPREMTYNVTKCDIRPAIKTDHKLISLNLKFNGNEKCGPGLWKFNKSLLYDATYVQEIKKIFTEEVEIDHKGLKWEFIKMKIRTFSIRFAKEKAKRLRDEIKEINDEIQLCNNIFEQDPSEHNHDKLLMAKQKLESMNKVKTEGVLLRSKAKWVEHGERNTKYFLNLEKRNHKEKHITKLKINETNHVTQPHLIREQMRSFYENLYGSEERSDIFDAMFLDNLPQLDDVDKETTEGTLSIDELSYAVLKMKCGKSPGTDGLTSEFYKFFWCDIKHLVFESLSTAYSDQLLSQEQRRAVLRLIPKKDKDITELKNWRPISLLNTDYKILTLTLANRLQSVLPKLISLDQNAYIKGRFIGYSIRSILDTIELHKTKQIKSIIAFLDFEKAFDKIRWSFMKKCLSKFGFGANFMKWITILYTDISSCVINNGYTTNYFRLKCGIRQGCPLSSLLFILCSESLAIAIRTNKNIRGIRFGQNEKKLTQLADDTTLLLADIQSLQVALNLLHMFHKSSGLKLNYKKTEILNCGYDYNSKENPFNLSWVKERVYALGTWFYKDISQCTLINHEMRLQMMRNVIESWKHRHASLYGKVAIIKSLIISKVNYCLSSLPTPQWFIKDVQNDINGFLWNNKPPRLKHTTAISDYKKGGIKMIDFESFVRAQKLCWIKRIATGNSTSLSVYLTDFVPSIPISEFLCCSIKPNDLPANIPLFYKQILHTWFLYKTKNEKPDYIALWYNQNIKIDNSYVFYKKWYEKGIFLLKDLYDDNGTILSYIRLQNRYGFRDNVMNYLSIIHAIPTELKQMQFTRDRQVVPTLFGCDITKLSSKSIYAALIEKIEIEPTSINSWATRDNINFTVEEWSKIYILPFTLTKSTRLREFQLKINHRIYASDSFVSNFDPRINKNCNTCLVPNSIIHTFFDCQLLHAFLNKLEKWIQDNIITTYKLEIIKFMFGCIQKKSFIINFIEIHVKYFIHTSRIQHREAGRNSPMHINFQSFLNYLKYVVNVEKQIAIDNSDHSSFKDRFDCLINIFDLSV